MIKNEYHECTKIADPCLTVLGDEVEIALSILIASHLFRVVPCIAIHHPEYCQQNYHTNQLVEQTQRHMYLSSYQT